MVVRYVLYERSSVKPVSDVIKCQMFKPSVFQRSLSAEFAGKLSLCLSKSLGKRRFSNDCHGLSEKNALKHK